MSSEKDARINIRVTKKDKDSIKRIAAEMGLNITEYLRWLHMWNVRHLENARQNTSQYGPLGD